ncbi:hypothetical protein BPORC_1809 [Bifidobacterium porcinum]|nr:hypothetical protein BPORC_1809 [Bifidobacterium porcinum]
MAPFPPKVPGVCRHCDVPVRSSTYRTCRTRACRRAPSKVHSKRTHSMATTARNVSGTACSGAFKNGAIAMFRSAESLESRRFGGVWAVTWTR